jgi:molybdate transport system substrate-binding protein
VTMRLLTKFYITASFLFLNVLIVPAQERTKVFIAAASDLKFALDAIVEKFERNHQDLQLEVTYGSSGKLYEQITHSAPFDLFFSADISYPQQLRAKGLSLSKVYSYGTGRIVLWSNKVDPSIKKMNLLLDPEIRKIAIANPTHAPYGKRAEEALKHYGLYSKVSAKLVFGENISQTAQFITTGAADIGIIALSLAMSPAMKELHGMYYLIPEDSHQPLVQGFVVLTHAKENKGAAAFRDYVLTQEVRDMLSDFGFAPAK